MKFSLQLADFELHIREIKTMAGLGHMRSGQTPPPGLTTRVEKLAQIAQDRRSSFYTTIRTPNPVLTAVGSQLHLNHASRRS